MIVVFVGGEHHAFRPVRIDVVGDVLEVRVERRRVGVEVHEHEAAAVSDRHVAQAAARRPTSAGTRARRARACSCRRGPNAIRGTGTGSHPGTIRSRTRAACRDGCRSCGARGSRRSRCARRSPSGRRSSTPRSPPARGSPRARHATCHTRGHSRSYSRATNSADVNRSRGISSLPNACIASTSPISASPITRAHQRAEAVVKFVTMACP